MKKLIFATILFLTVVSLNGQSSYISISLGTSIPKGDFSLSENLFNDGFAVSGFSIEFDGVYFPTSIIGVGGMIGFGSMYTGQDEYYEMMGDYVENHPDLFGVTFPDIQDASFTTGFWNYVNLLVGPELSAPIWRFQIGVRAMGGMSVVMGPKREFVYENGLDFIEISTRGTDLSLAYLYGGSLMYKLSAGTAIRVAADYYNSRADTKFALDAETPVGTVNETKAGDVDLSTLQISFGLSYTF